VSSRSCTGPVRNRLLLPPTVCVVFMVTVRPRGIGRRGEPRGPTGHVRQGRHRLLGLADEVLIQQQAERPPGGPPDEAPARLPPTS
jgi:hypothetical protein